MTTSPDGTMAWQLLVGRLGGQNIPCPFCGRLFDHKHNFLSHYKTHTGERPYGCPYCSYRTIQRGNLKTHIRK
ncbi:hypothetical protein SK128_027458, partial [Halocaridina rubra]